MNKVPSWLKGLLWVLDALLKYGLVLFFTSAALMYLAQITLRLAHRSVLWLDPLLQYLFVLAALFGAAYGVKTGEYVNIGLFRKIGKKRALRATINLVAAVVSGFMAAAFVMRVPQDLSHNEASDFVVPKWVLNLPYILLFAISALYFTVRALFPGLDVEAEGHGASALEQASPPEPRETTGGRAP